MKKITILILLLFTSLNVVVSQNKNYQKEIDMTKKKVKKTDEEWRNILNDEEFRVLREKGTEYPHTGKYNLHFENGVYNCNGCNTPLFESDQKFESDCGWPSFDDAIEGAVKYVDDFSHNMVRTEIVCVRCMCTCLFFFIMFLFCRIVEFCYVRFSFRLLGLTGRL